MFGFDDDNQTKTKTKEREVIDAEVYQPPVLSSGAPTSTGELVGFVRAAQELPPRDFEQVEAHAREIGRRLGSELDAQGQGTAAYYSFPAGGATIEGPTIGAMDSLAGAWGKIAYDTMIVEERGNTVKLRCRVVDLVTLVSHARDFSASLSPAPGKFEKKPDQIERWRTMQLSSATSKAMRAILEHVIPAWVINAMLEEAKKAAAAVRMGGATSVEEAAKVAVDRFATIGFTLPLLEGYVEAPVGKWTGYEIGTLRNLWGAVKRGEATLATVQADVAARAEDTPPSAGGLALDDLGLGKASGKGGGERKPRQAKAKAPEAPKAEEPKAPLPPSDNVPPADRAPLIKEARSYRDILGAEAATKAQVELGISPALTYEGMLYDDLVRLVKHMDEIIGPKEP